MAIGVIITAVELPNNCITCSLVNNHYYCKYVKGFVKDYSGKERHPMCPIKTLPEYEEINSMNTPLGPIIDKHAPWKKGWNACIDTFLGDESAKKHVMMETHLASLWTRK